MRGCQFCGFLSDPATGNIYDPAYPCPKCGKRAVKVIPPPAPRPMSGVGSGLGEPMTVGANIIAAAKLAGLGASFIYLRNKLAEEPVRRKLGSRINAFKKASYFIPAIGAPYLVEILTKEEWPILGTLFQVGMGGLAIKTALEPQN